MLSPNQLERAPQAYRRGYRDGYYNKPNQAEIDARDQWESPFSRADYNKGYAAGANDAYWDELAAIGA